MITTDGREQRRGKRTAGRQEIIGSNGDYMAEKKDNIIGIAFEMDVEDLKAGLAETKKAITTANKEFSAATSGMDDWTKSSEGLNAKLKQLDTVLSNQKKNLKGYEAALEQAKEEHGENSEEVRRLKDKLLDAQAAIGKTEKQIRKYSSALTELDSENKDAETSTQKLSKSMKTANTSTSQLKEGFTVLKGVLAGLITTGINKLVSCMQQAVEQSKEWRREMAYLEIAAESAGVSYDEAAERIGNITAITTDQGAAIEALNNLMSAGFKGDALDQITDELLGASILWKDTLKFESLADSLQETLAKGKLSGQFKELFERCGVAVDGLDLRLSELSTTEERQKFILQQLSDKGLAAAKDRYVELNPDIIAAQRATDDFDAAQAKLGARIEPVMTSIKMGYIDILNAFLDMDSGSDFEGLSQKIRDAFQWFIDTCVPIIKDAINFALEHKNAVLAGVVAIGGAFAAWKVYEVVTGAVKAVKGMITSLATLYSSILKTTASFVAQKAAMVAGTVATNAAAVAQRLLNLAMSANPIMLVVTAIGILVTAFVTLWNKSEAFRNFWIGLWESIKRAFQPVIDLLVTVFTGAWEAIKNVWNTVSDFFTGIVNSIVEIFTGLPGKMLQIGKDIIQGLIDGITNMIQKVKDVVKNVADSIVGGIKGLFGIHSPSTVMRDEVGKMIGEGISDGIMASSEGVGETVSEFSEGVKAQLQNGFSDTNVNLEDVVSLPDFDGTVNKLAETVQSLKDLFTIGWQQITEAWNAATPYFISIWEIIYGTYKPVPAVFKDLFSKAWVNVQNAWSGAIAFFTSIYNGIYSRFAGLPGTFYSLGINMMQGLINGVKAKIAEAERVLAECSQKMVAAAKARLKISSPSKVMRDEVGAMIGAGIGEGIIGSTGSILRDVSTLTNAIRSGLTSRLSGLTASISASVPNLASRSLPAAQSSTTIVNHNYNQVINAPKSPSRLELYRQTKNLLAMR